MREEKISDTRFPVYNTKLAACLVTLGFLVKKVQPFMRVIDADNGDTEQVTIFLEPSTRQESAHLKYKLPDGKMVLFKAWDFEVAWKMRKEWESRNPIHPFNDMRKAIEAREWIIQNFIRSTPPLGTLPPPPASNQFRTGDFKLACCLKALGNYLYANENNEFIFEAGKSMESDAETFKGAPANNQIQWMKLALVNYELLNRRMREKDNVAVVKRERVVGGKRRVLLIPINCPDEIREQFEELFYANK